MVARGRDGAGLRERTRNRTREEIQAAGMRLFAERGFDGTTVAEIAEEAGVAPRTFFRYFRSKEDLVVDAPIGYGAVLAEALASRPVDEPVWTSLRAVLRTRVAYWEQRPATAQQVVDLLAASPGLQGRLRSKTDHWHEELAATLRSRLEEQHAGDDGPRDVALAADALVGAAIGCLDAAFTAWQRERDRDLGELFDAALSTVRPR